MSSKWNSREEEGLLLDSLLGQENFNLSKEASQKDIIVPVVSQYTPKPQGFKSENLEENKKLQLVSNSQKTAKKIEEQKKLSVASTPFNYNNKSNLGQPQDYSLLQQSWETKNILNMDQASFISQESESLLFPSNISNMGIFNSQAQQFDFPSKKEKAWNKSNTCKSNIKNDENEKRRALKPSLSLRTAGSRKSKPLILSIQKERIFGRLKFFDHKKKYGFITAEDESQTEYFCHFDDFKDSQISLGKLKELVRNKYQVSFECLNYIGKAKEGKKAVKIRIESTSLNSPSKK